MIPQSIATFIGFLLLVAPGLLFELLREKRRAVIEETAFREASRIAFSSLMFTIGAVSVLGVIRAAFPELIPDPRRWLVQKGAYLDAHYRLIFRFALIEVLLARWASLVLWTGFWRAGSKDISFQGAPGFVF